MNLQPLFSPRSIAVIGASTRPGSVGSTLTENLLAYGYTGRVYPVNPKAETLFGLQCFASIHEIKAEVDLAIIIIPAALVLGALREAGEKNVKAVIIISAGFKETGEAGMALEREVIRIAREFDIALLGPNCLGFLRPKIGLNASFAKGMANPGSIAFFSQSGALCTALLDLTHKTLGFSSFVSVGNKAVLSEIDFLEYYASEQDTKVIAFYSEGLRDAKSIIETGRAILLRAEPKPVIALKSGTTEAGTAASSSHTGALAGSEKAYQALFRQARIVRATSLQSLSEILSVFSQNPLPEGKNIGIITNAGGLGVLATDEAVRQGLTIAPLSEETKRRLEALPPSAGHNNPVDVLGDALAPRYELALDALLHDRQVHMILVIVTPQAMTQAKETAEVIAFAKKHSGKPIVVVLAGQDALEESSAILAKNEVATLTYPEAGARALAHLAHVAQWRRVAYYTPFSFKDIDLVGAQKIVQGVRQGGRTNLYETEVWQILTCYGFRFLKSASVSSAKEAQDKASLFDGPIAMKIVSPDITHKSDAGGVALGVNPKDAGKEYEALLQRVSEHAKDARLEGALIVEMAQKGGREIILGLKHEVGLGKLIMVGLGGIFVETFKDVAFRFAPLSTEDAREMIGELQALPLLQGTRGQSGVDTEALVAFIGRISRLATDFPEIEELDINPLLAFQNGQDFRVLDARIRLSDQTGTKKKVTKVLVTAK